MIDWTDLTRDVLDAMAGEVDDATLRQIARTTTDRLQVDRRTFSFEILKEEPTWKDRERARRVRLALYEADTPKMVYRVVRLKVDELVDEIGRMTGHERVVLRRRLVGRLISADAQSRD